MYTKKGDLGTSTILHSKARIIKSDLLFEALGSVDELNSLVGVCKTKATSQAPVYNEKTMQEILHFVQEQLFIIQADLAGANVSLKEEAIETSEEIIDLITKKIPPITSFFIAGGTELAAFLDYARTVCRRVERVLIQAEAESNITLGATEKAFLNRLSSLLFALTRWENHIHNVNEHKPQY